MQDQLDEYEAIMSRNTIVSLNVVPWPNYYYLLTQFCIIIFDRYEGTKLFDGLGVLFQLTISLNVTPLIKLA